jgi:hypothetical protein
LICWQHGEIPAIAAALGNVSPSPPSSWPNDRFDVIWTFTKAQNGWTFAQIQEVAIPGDQPTPIDG